MPHSAFSAQVVLGIAAILSVFASEAVLARTESRLLDTLRGEPNKISKGYFQLLRRSNETGEDDVDVVVGSKDGGGDSWPGREVAKEGGRKKRSDDSVESLEPEISMANKEISDLTFANFADSSSNAEKAATADDIKLYLLVQRLLNETPLIDGHNDLPWNLRQFLHGQLQNFNFTDNLKTVQPWSQSVWSHTDLPRLRLGRVGAQFWVAYARCESQNKNAVQITLEQIDLIRRLIAKYPEHMKLALSADDIVKAHKEGKIASLISVEGGHSIGNSLATLRAFYDLGVRSMTLTHSCNTAWADSSTVDDPGNRPVLGGLTEFGRTVVNEMNRVGMVVDLSHTSKLTMMDALKVSKAPVIFSHSCAYALCNSTRNVPDDILQELVHNRGMVMVTFFNQFVKCDNFSTVRDVADHINYIRGKIGIGGIGIGGGFDGINQTPEGLQDVSMYPNLFVELARSPGWSNDDLKKVAGENFLRVFREAEHTRDSMRSAGATASFEYIPMPVYPQETLRCRYNISYNSPSSSIH